MAKSEELKIPRLNSDNYESWATRMKVYLMAKGQWQVASGESSKPTSGEPLKEWSEKNAKGLAVIMNSVNDSQLSYIRECDTSKDAWDKLKGVHEPKSAHRSLSLMKEFLQFRVNNGNESIDDAITRLDHIVTQLISLNNSSIDKMKGLVFLAGLPTEYEPLIVILEGSEKLEWDNIIA